MNPHHVGLRARALGHDAQRDTRALRLLGVVHRVDGNPRALFELLQDRVAEDLPPDHFLLFVCSRAAFSPWASFVASSLAQKCM